MGRFLSPDPLGGHTEDPQTLNKYAYVRNNPLTLTDPTGLDFSLSCAKNNGTTCQNGTTYYKDQDGDYKQTLIHSDDKGNLSDQSGNKYTANVTGAGVTFTGNGGTNVAGTFVNGTNATTINGSGALTGFTFNFTGSNMASHESAIGTYSYNGTADQAINALQSAGFKHYAWDDIDALPPHYSTLTYDVFDLRGPGGQGGVGAGHIDVHIPVDTRIAGLHVTREQMLGVPTYGSADLGTTNPYNGGLGTHIQEVINHYWNQ
jgi:hypothetical protein